MAEVTRNIVIVGGGTAGWLTAALLAKQHGHALTITLVESSDIPTVGVGEGTWPSMRTTLQKVGISETEFIRQCTATFKQASRFVNWIDKENDEYFHPFTQPVGADKIDIAAYWQQLQPNIPFCDAVTVQAQLCKQGIAPKSIAHREYDTAANYGYHLDAGKFAELLKNHCVSNLNVRHVVGTVTAVQQDEHENIRAVVTAEQGTIAGELFVDCSGFKSLLLGETLKVPFISKQDVLLADTAIAVQVPYPDPEHPIACHTISTAQSAGWIWDIGLQQRRGVGYVYASQYASHAEAEQTLRNYIGDDIDDCSIKTIKFNAGHRAQFWKNNCVAVGLSSGFLEPLEASALMLVETAANFIADQLPVTSAEMAPVARRFNQVFAAKWRGIIDFLKLHYVMSKRTEPFWQANKDPNTIPESLTELLTLWQHRTPNEYDFMQDFEAFSAASYAYVLYGTGFKTDLALTQHRLTQPQRANKFFAIRQQQSEQLPLRLPRHRELINQVLTQGFAQI
ncbi:tryptophan halogenase family protein [Alteromonas flava]|uniref:tryptophan halogenase family protein n=1 Tax=Alteromonas flava TaxID=2048003 RepID=UPI000C29302D|nr:tryptophan halogenase family protein [Alteromonas flava]